jgi:ATP-dependent DNA helicase RecQ
LINSTISPVEIQDILSDLENNKLNPIKFLYIAPERLHSGSFLNTIKRVKIAQVAIDEAHCISQWGHDFRPSYMKILKFITDLKDIETNDFPIVALTATATKKVRADIIDKL